MAKINSVYDIGAAFEAIEEELSASMIRNMKRHKAEESKEGFEWSQWQAEQLRFLAEYKKRNQKKYGKQFKSLNSRIDILIRAARDEGGMQQEIQILNAIKKGFTGAKKIGRGMTGEFFRINDRKLDALIKAVVSDMEKAETAVLRMADDQYRKIIYNAQVYANTGAGTYEKAVDMATKDFLSAGLNCVQSKNGARHTLADYADMAIRTASKRAYLQGEGEKRQEWGISTVIVNKRGNPCPKCLPFCGKVLIDDVWSGGKRADGPYPLMSKAIEYGLYHPRCRDSHTTYFPGVSTAEDTWTEEELKAIGQAGEKEAKQQYAKRQAEKYGRLAKYSLDPENRRKYRTKAAEWKEKIKSPEYLPVRNWEQLNIETMERLEREMNLLPESHQEFLETSGVEVEILSEGNSFYDPRNRTIYLTDNFESFEGVHEIAHALEDILHIWDDSEFRKLAEQIASEHTERDIIWDRDTFVKPIRKITDRRFVSEYQGRVYPEAGEAVNGHVNLDALWDYFSEGYRCFFENPKLLLEKDPDLFEYIKERFDG